MPNIDIELGDLSSVEQCESCKRGDHGNCSANFKWHADRDRRDIRWGRCGEFEEIWAQRLQETVGHGVLLRTRQPNPNTSIQIYWKGANNLGGWIMGIGEDEIGQYVEIEPTEIDTEHPFFFKEDQSTKPVRYYMEAILGVSIYKQTRELGLL